MKDNLTALKLFPIVCCYGWQGWKWIELEKIGPIFSSFDARPSKITKKIIVVSSS